VSTVPGASAVAIATGPADFTPFDTPSWDRWVSEGRDADAAFRQKARIVAIISASLIAFGMLWMTFAG
jgi:hypothetical protein